MTPEARTATRYTIGAILGIAVLATSAYLPVLGTGFTSDDFFILSRVRALNGLEHPLAYFRFGFFDYYRPLVFLSHAIDWQTWGLNPVGYHLRSLMFHAGCSVLVLLIGRRFLSPPVAAVAAALFALHPASHEAVYWMAARFDLMATFFTLVAVGCLADDRPLWRALGIVAFALGLLSKESAVSLVIIAPAWDVFVARRPFRDVVRRLLPLLFVVLAYAVVRTFGADLEATGGARRLPKAMMALALLGSILLVAWRREPSTGPGSSRPVASATPWLMALMAGIALVAALIWPVTSNAVARALGFAAYVAFYFVSPVVFPSPSSWVFAPIVWSDALIGLTIVLLILATFVQFRHALARQSEALFLCIFIAAALLPVSSMAGGLRYLYLATAGVALLAGWLLDRVRGRARLVAAVAVTAVIVVSLTQLMEAGRRWRAGAEMQRTGVLLMAAASRPCDSTDIVLLTTPSGVGGVYANFLYEAFGVLTDCTPRSFTTLLRVVGSDAHVDVAAVPDGSIELRVPDYRGNILASADLSTFLEPITPGRRMSLDTAIGHLDTFGNGTTQIFRITLNPTARAAAQFYYSDGAIHAAR
jgi:hypothetical protein